jgi:hypothetical protein
MSYAKYVMSHLVLVIIALMVGFYICKKQPGLFGNLPVLGAG